MSSQEGGAMGDSTPPLHAPQGQLSYLPVCLHPTFLGGGWPPTPPPPFKRNYIIPTDGELSREPGGFAIDPLGGAADNGRSALPGPVCSAGAFLWPQRQRRRQKQRAAARPTLCQVAVLGIPARALLSQDYIWKEGRAGQLHVLGGARAHGLGAAGRGRDTCLK